MGLKEHELEIAKLLKCINVDAKNTLKDVARAMYKCKGKATKDGKLPLVKYMENARKKANFTECYEKLLHSNLMECDFDISPAHIIIKEICDDIYNKLTLHCKDRISSLVKFRNEMCHDCVLKKIDVKKRACNLIAILEDIYRGVAKTLNQVSESKSPKFNFDNNILRVRKSIKEILDSTIIVGEASNLILDFKTSLIYKLLETGTQDLNKCYKNLQELNPCPWIDHSTGHGFQLDKVFTVPKLKSDGMEIKLSNLLTEKVIELVPNFILLQGDAGTGKSSFCYYLVNTWRKQPNMIRDLKKFKFILLVEISKTTSTTIEQYLREELMPQTYNTLKREDIMQLLKDLEIMFIVDGYDEKNNTSATLMESIHKEFGNKRIIITTRTTFTEEIIKTLKENNTQFLLVDLKGFDEASQKMYTKRVFEAMNLNESREGFDKYLKGKGKVLGAHLSLPLIIALLIVLWIDNHEDVNNVTTITELYRELFELFQRKLRERLTKRNMYNGAKVLKNILARLLLLIGRKTLERLCENSDVRLKESDFEKECKEEQIDHPDFKNELLSAFLKCELTKTKERAYMFFHKTQLEYLASLYIAVSVQKGKVLNTFTESIKDWKKYDQLLIYLTGNMALTKTLSGKEKDIVSLISKTGVQTLNYSYRWNILFESKIKISYDLPGRPITFQELVHPELGELIASEHLFTHVAWRPNYQNIAAALRLISLIPVSVDSLRIEVPLYEEPFNIPDFIEALEEVKVHKYECKKAISTDLLLWEHYSHECTRNSDRFLQALKPWAKLDNFTGSLESSESLKKQFPKVKNLRCKIRTPEVLKAFRNLRSSVTVVRLSLAFTPDECSSEIVKDLSYAGKLVLYFHYIVDDHLEWMCDVTEKLSRRYGCNALCMPNCKISSKGLQQLLDTLSGFFQGDLEISFSSITDIDQDDILDLARDTTDKFNITWL